jgi:hypothetical protein
MWKRNNERRRGLKPRPRVAAHYSPDPIVTLVERAGGPAIVNDLSLQRLYHRGRRAGYYTETVADRLAVALGYHPCRLWPEWFDAEVV